MDAAFGNERAGSAAADLAGLEALLGDSGFAFPKVTGYIDRRAGDDRVADSTASGQSSLAPASRIAGSGASLTTFHSIAAHSYRSFLQDRKHDHILLAQAAPKPGDGRTNTASDSAHAQAQPDLNRAQERLKLESLASGLLKKRDLSRLVDEMNTFETRCQSSGLSDRQIAETYSHVARLLSAPSAVLPADQRIKVAQQIVRNAARPTSIDQGHHGTCNVTVVETRTYTRSPESAAKLVADIATTGSFTTKDGFAITPTKRSLTLDEESSNNPPGDGERGLASQIFQITAANVFWQRRIVTPDSKLSSWGSIVYEQIPNKRSRFTGDSGERVMDYSVNPPRETTKYEQGPALSVSDLPEIYNQITGANDTNFVIENKVHGGANTIQVSSPRELETAITTSSPNFPLFIRVHTGNEPFLSDQGGSFARQRGVWHVVSIIGYDRNTKKVIIDNQWGKHADRSIDLDKLYKATMEPGTPEWKKKHEYFSLPGIKSKRAEMLPYQF